MNVYTVRVKFSICSKFVLLYTRLLNKIVLITFTIPKPWKEGQAREGGLIHCIDIQRNFSDEILVTAPVLYEGSNPRNSCIDVLCRWFRKMYSCYVISRLIFVWNILLFSCQQMQLNGLPKSIIFFDKTGIMSFFAKTC